MVGHRCFDGRDSHCKLVKLQFNVVWLTKLWRSERLTEANALVELYEMVEVSRVDVNGGCPRHGISMSGGIYKSGERSVGAVNLSDHLHQQ